MWAFSVNYPVFFTLIFHACSFSQKRYLSPVVATNEAPLCWCVRWYLKNEGQSTVCRTLCRLLRPFFCNRLHQKQIHGTFA